MTAYYRKMPKMYRWLTLFVAVVAVGGLALFVKIKISQAQACSGCRTPNIQITSVSGPADLTTTVTGSFSAGGYYSSNTCYPRQFQSGSFAYRLLNSGGSPVTGWTSIADSAMTQTQAGYNVNGVVTCPSTNQYVYSFSAQASTASVPGGTYIVELRATGRYSTINSQQVTRMSGSFTVEHSGAGQITANGMAVPTNNQIIVAGNTAQWNITAVCSDYSGTVDFTANVGFANATYEWLNGASIVSTNNDALDYPCGSTLTLRVRTNSSTSPLSSPAGSPNAQLVQVTIHSSDNSASPGTAEAYLTVYGQPQITSLAASPNTVAAGTTVYVSWASQYVNANGCTQSVSSGSATGWNSVATSSAGTNVPVVVNTVPATLTLTCSGYAGSTNATASTSVASAGNFTFSLAPNQEVIRGGSINFILTANCTSPFAGPITGLTTQTTTGGVTYSFVNVSTGAPVTQVACGGQVRMLVSANNSATAVSWPGSVTPVTVQVRGTGTTIGTITGGSFNLTIWGNPTISQFIVTPPGGQLGTTPSTTWTSQFTGGCAASSSPTDSTWNGGKAANGNQVLSMLSNPGTYTYSLACGGGPGTATTSTSTQITISGSKIRVDYEINNTTNSYPSWSQEIRANYYIVDRTTNTVVVPQTYYFRPQEFITGFIPGHEYELMYWSGHTTNGNGTPYVLYRKKTPFITDGAGVAVSRQTMPVNGTLTFKLRFEQSGTVSGPLGGGCLQYNIAGNVLSSRNYRLSSYASAPMSQPAAYFTPNAATNFFSENTSLYSISPNSSAGGAQVTLTPGWNPGLLQLREGPGIYEFYVYSTQMNDPSSECSEMLYYLQVDAPATPTYTFTATSSIRFVAYKDGALPAQYPTDITNTGNQTQNFTLSGAPSWLTVNPTSYTGLPGAVQTVNFQPNTTNMPVGNYSTVVRVMNQQGVFHDIIVYYDLISVPPVCPATGNTVQLSAAAANVGSSVTASAPAGYSGGAFVSSNTSIATISGSTVNAINGRPGTGSVQITGTGWSYTHPDSSIATGCSLAGTTFSVRDFELVSTNSQTITQGQTAALTYQVQSINGFTGSVSLTILDAPTTPGTHSASPSGPVNSFPANITVNVPTNASTAVGTYNVRLRGTSAGSNRNATGTLVINSGASADIKASRDGSNWTDGPLTIGYNWSPYLRWNSTSTSACTVTGNSGSWSGTSNSSQSAGNQTTNQTYSMSCNSGAVTDSVTVNVFNNVPTNVQAFNSITDSSVSCGQIKVTWTASSGASSYKLFRNTVNNVTGATEVDAAITKPGTSYTYTPADTNMYYYFVKAVDGAGNESNYSAASAQNGAASVACSLNFSTSDIEITQVNTTVNSPTPTDCNRNTQSYNAVQGLLRRGNRVAFKVNICNSGTVDFTPTAGNPIIVTTTLANLSFVAGQSVSYSCGSCSGTYQLVPGSGSAPDVVVFRLTGGTLARQSGGNPSVWSISFSADTRSPSGSNSTIFRFNNRADIRAGSITNSFSTPYYFFYFNQANPVIREVSH